jgi:twitching motility protein PilT
VESQSQIRHTLSENLKAVISQDLIRVADGRGRRVAVEIMVITPAISQLIRDGKTHQILSAMSTGRKLGMQLMDQALLSLVQAGEVDPDEAFLRATDKRDFIPFVTTTELLNMADGTSGSSTSAGG